MIRIKIITAFIFLFCFILNGYTQSNRNYMDAALRKGKNIRCGKIDFIIKERSKGAKNYTESHASLIFNNRKKKKFNECSYINLSFKEDSIQYIGTPTMLVTIDHKRKKILIDSSKDACNHTNILLSEFMAFYTDDLASTWFIEKPIQKRLKETDSSVVFTLQSKKLKPMMTEKYQKKMEKDREKHKNDPFYIFKIIQTPYIDV